MSPPENNNPTRNAREPSAPTKLAMEKSIANGNSIKHASPAVTKPHGAWLPQLALASVVNGLGLGAARIIATYDAMHPRRQTSFQPPRPEEFSVADWWRQTLERAGLGAWADRMAGDGRLGGLAALIDEFVSNLSSPTAPLFVAAVVVYATILLNNIGVNSPKDVQRRAAGFTILPAVAIGLFVFGLDLQAVLLELLPPVLLVVSTLLSAWSLLARRKNTN